jgi:hypothetical protein
MCQVWMPSMPLALCSLPHVPSGCPPHPQWPRGQPAPQQALQLCQVLAQHLRGAAAQLLVALRLKQRSTRSAGLWPTVHAALQPLQLRPAPLQRTSHPRRHHLEEAVGASLA